RSGFRRTTSRAWVPTDPVDPRMISDRIAPLRLPRGQRLHRQERRPGSMVFFPVTSPKRPRNEPGLEQQQTEEVEGGGSREQDRVDAVQDAAVSGEKAAHVLDPEVALEQ